MSVRVGAPYQDEVNDNGSIIIYEGHDVSNNGMNIPKQEDQSSQTNTGKLTENGKFFEAAERYKAGTSPAELIKVYEKIKSGIWAFAGYFLLIDAWQELRGNRVVFKFKLAITDYSSFQKEQNFSHIEHNRIIPTQVKIEVRKRDGGKCVQCGSKENLHFDHIIPYAKGGTSLKVENIQILCAKHNLQKRDCIV